MLPTEPASDADLLRRAGLRVTAPRLAILRAVRDGDHLSVDDIWSSAHARLGSLSRQAAYGVLRLLEEAGLARRIEPMGSPARYEGRVGDNHHHLVCRSCGAISDVDCAVGHAPCLEPMSAAGFLVDEADVTYWGICPQCQVRSSAQPPSAPTRRTAA